MRPGGGEAGAPKAAIVGRDGVLDTEARSRPLHEQRKMAFKVHALFRSADPAMWVKRPRVWEYLRVGVDEIGDGAAGCLLVGLVTIYSHI